MEIHCLPACLKFGTVPGWSGKTCWEGAFVTYIAPSTMEVSLVCSALPSFKRRSEEQRQGRAESTSWKPFRGRCLFSPPLELFYRPCHSLRLELTWSGWFFPGESYHWGRNDYILYSEKIRSCKETGYITAINSHTARREKL